VVSYSDVKGGEAQAYVEEGCTLDWGIGNIEDDPLFVDPDGPDDDPDTWEDNDYHLSPGSPSIDTGTNGALPPDVADLNTNGDTDEPIPLDMDGNLRIVDGDDNGEPVVDMGAYEYAAGCPYIYDFDGSCFVDVADLGLFAACWLLSTGEAGWNENDCADKDFDCSGTVDATDLGLFAGAWQKWDYEFDPADYPECRTCGVDGIIICP